MAEFFTDPKYSTEQLRSSDGRVMDPDHLWMQLSTGKVGVAGPGKVQGLSYPGDAENAKYFIKERAVPLPDLRRRPSRTMVCQRTCVRGRQAPG